MLSPMPPLRRSDASVPGYTRRRAGRGFAYYDTHGVRIADAETRKRIESLGIPPAWRDVWICPHPNGHLQALGTDAAGRRQYRYHPQWRLRRDQEKFDDMVRFAKALSALRKNVVKDLAGEEPTRPVVLACAVRLLDIGFFRIGSEDYALRNESYGLATMLKEHVTVEGDVILFDYTAKHGKHRLQAVADPAVAEIVGRLRRRRSGGDELLAYKDAGTWRDVRSDDINVYLKEVTGGDFSAKDFRTWSATVLAAIALGVSGEVAKTRTGRKRAINRAIQEVAHYLGNTPAVARASYVDPRVIDAYCSGLTLLPALQEASRDGKPGELMMHHPAVEAAVLDLIDECEESPALAQVA
jgi:DNA topoisomerase-1